MAKKTRQKQGDENFIVFLIDAVRQALGPQGLSADHADAIKSAIIRDYGGDTPYICKIDPDRRAKVLKAFNGRNRDAVCERFKISRSQFYYMLKGR